MTRLSAFSGARRPLLLVVFGSCLSAGEVSIAFLGELGQWFRSILGPRRRLPIPSLGRSCETSLSDTVPRYIAPPPPPLAASSLSDVPSARRPAAASTVPPAAFNPYTGRYPGDTRSHFAARHLPTHWQAKAPPPPPLRLGADSTLTARLPRPRCSPGRAEPGPPPRACQPWPPRPCPAAPPPMSW